MATKNGTLDSRETKKQAHNKLSVAGFLIALGVVYGDIGTSPLYVFKSIIEENGGLQTISTDFVLGIVSLIFWTLTIVTTIKYVLIALRADNNGEGGIFALYTLVRKKGKWLIIPAMIGGATFLADGMMTPAVTVTTAIEELKGMNLWGSTPITTQTQVVIITVVILSVLFFIQRFGTEMIGKAFGPIMMFWFGFLGVIGIYNLMGDISFIRALNPYYAIKLLMSPQNINGLFILGSIFLATTGAEALYSDMGHVGRGNIYGSWPFVKVCLLLNYLGQAVWVEKIRTSEAIQSIPNMNPFFQAIPEPLRIFSILLATAAAIIASQALISGSYTLVSEATKLKIFPRLRTYYPSNFKGQLYIPTVNNILWIACIFIVFFFKTSARMSAVYGLEITITMLMTTILLYQWLLSRKNINKGLSTLTVSFFFFIEIIFFITNSKKFINGAYITMSIALALICMMFVWLYGDYLKDNNTFRRHYVSLLAYKKQLHDLQTDESLPIFAENLVYLTKVKDGAKIRKNIIYSILDKRPKRARIYWFVTVNVTDEPYTTAYTVETFGTDYMVNVQLYLGFRIDQKVNVFLRQIVNDMISDGELKPQPQKYTTIPDRAVGDFSFVLIKEVLSPETQVNWFNKLIVSTRLSFQKFISPANWFGLSYSDVIEERVPLVIGRLPVQRFRLSRIKQEDTSQIEIEKEIDINDEDDDGE